MTMIEGRAVVVVTGGASGIGAGLCRHFARDEDKTVVVADVDEAAAAGVAAEIGGAAVACDVSDGDQVIELVRHTEDRFGPIEVFCSNAGIFVNGVLDVSDELWQRIWNVNVMSHVHAARAVIPRMLERGGGSFVVTASAAGLLSQVGSAPYSTTKHAAVGLAESLAIAYGDRGLKVLAICPQAVQTKMTAGGAAGADLDGMLTPEDVAEALAEAMRDERFLVLPHPTVKKYFMRKASDYERWLRGMRRLRQSVETET